MKALPEAGLEVPHPDGAFYILLSCQTGSMTAGSLFYASARGSKGCRDSVPVLAQAVKVMCDFVCGLDGGFETGG